MVDWSKVVDGLNPPFNSYPLWALELDMEIADIAGDVYGDDGEDDATPEMKATMAAYDKIREIIARMVARGPTIISPPTTAPTPPEGGKDGP